MIVATFDTLAYANKLRDAGFPILQAEALAQAQKESLSEALDAALATKADISEVKADIAEVKTDIIDVRGEIVKVDRRIDTINGELRLIKWMLAVVIAVTVLPTLKTLLGG